MSIIAISGKMQSGKNTIASIIQYLTHEYEIHGQITQSFDDFKNFKYDNDAFKWKQVAFAGKLKQIVSILTGIPVEDLEKQEVKDSLLGEEWIRYAYAIGHKTDNNGNKEMISKDCSREVYEYERSVNWQTAYKLEYTVRLLLQKIGTDAMRDVIHPNIWVNALFADYKDVIEEGRGDDLAWMTKPNWIITDVRFPNELEAIKNRDGISIRINRPAITGEQFYNLNIGMQHPSETALDNAKFDYIIDNNGTIEELVEKVKDILIQQRII